MDPIGAVAAKRNNNKKRAYSYEAPNIQDDSMSSNPRLFPFSTRGGFETEVEHMFAQSLPKIIKPMIREAIKHFHDEILPKLEHDFRQQVSKEIESITLSKIHSLLPISILHENGQKEAPKPSRASKFMLCFSNSIPTTIFTNNEIKSENGEVLKVVIRDATKPNSIISTGPLSSAHVEFFLLHGEFESSRRRDEETSWTSSDFNRSILAPRDGKRPLIIGNDRQLYLKNGVGLVNSLIVTDNSSWMRSKRFCLGVRIIDETSSLANFGSIGEAVSEPFRVRDQRGEVNQKHHPPRREDEVWRLEGIRKDGIYHRNLSSQGIRTVGDFLKAYHEINNPNTLRMMLGRRVLDKTWKVIVQNAMECDDVSINNYQIFQDNDSDENNQVMAHEDFHEKYVGFMIDNLDHSYDLWQPTVDEQISDYF